jgi:hypothetical protein
MHIPQYPVPYSNHSGLKSNLVSTQGPNNKWIYNDPNQFTEPRKNSKGGKMPIGEHIITYNRYEPISNLIDLTTGNRSTKPATLKEIDNENLPTFKQKHDNKIHNCIYSTPNLQNINDPGPRQIKP